ncbi:MAG: hypothetical protein HRT44_10860 [Bdellovibrionales bacterium]|nr:hypothetical protein [Bdellovibrionales bacterium]
MVSLCTHPSRERFREPMARFWASSRTDWLGARRKDPSPSRFDQKTQETEASTTKYTSNYARFFVGQQ